MAFLSTTTDGMSSRKRFDQEEEEEEEEEEEDESNDDNEDSDEDEEDDGYDDEEEDEEEIVEQRGNNRQNNNNGKKNGKKEEEVPLWKRINQLNEEELVESSSIGSHTIGKLKRKRSTSDDGMVTNERPNKPSWMKDEKIVGRENKNAPAVMKSNRPVRRLRIDANNTTRKFRDPRFVEGSGTLDEDRFHQNYAFLDKYQEDEVNELTRAMKKSKNPTVKDQIKTELLGKKQEMTERRRSMKVKARLQTVRAEERQKVKNGKTPFFLKRSAKKQIALEERFDELKKDGKLNAFLMKKRKRNSNKEHKKMPRRREDA